MRVQWSWRCSEHAIQNTEEMRRAAKIDSNQTQIVKALRAIGATVLPMHTLGSGAPDILVGYRGENFALEIKDGEKAPSARKLTPDEEKWHREWQGHVTTVYDVVDALMAIGATK